MTIEQLKNNRWKIEKHFHNDECVYYFTAKKGRNILISNDGVTFSGLSNGQWI